MKVDINKIADDLIDKLSDNAKIQLGSLDSDDLISLHSSLGQDIRNEYNLWSTEWVPELVNGVDISKDHPDNVSMEIIKLMHTKLQGMHDQHRQSVITTYLKMGWRYIDDSIKDGEQYIVLVESSNVGTQDDLYTTTIGFNSLSDTGEDKWFLAGWDWQQDCYTKDTTGKPILYYSKLPYIEVK